MFCHKCASLLVRHDGELKCLIGNMALSKEMERLLTERYGRHLPSEQVGSVSIGRSTFYCPGCGVELDEKLDCPECHVSLQELLRPLVELHPHNFISTLTLGADADDELFACLVEAVKRLDGTIVDTEWQLGGSYEFTTFKISLPSGELAAVSDTLRGLYLRGEVSLVQQVAEQVRRTSGAD